MSEAKRWLDHTDIMEIYGVGIGSSYRIIREIRAMYQGKHPLPVGKVFATDLPLYEEKVRNGK